ncbi:MAG: hypothetical protein ACM3QW_00915 [Ignavibacteriales bacterium]
MPHRKDIAEYEVRILFKDPAALDLVEFAERSELSMASLVKMRIKSLHVKKYGLLMIGKGPISDILRVAETIYPITDEGAVEIIIKIADQEAFVIKDGRIHDCADPNFTGPVPKSFDEAPPTEEELNRIGFGV